MISAGEMRMSGASYLTEVRGLKSNVCLTTSSLGVVPHGGTWIEIHPRSRGVFLRWSYLTEVRGLKFVVSRVLQCGQRSYLTEVRGLKYQTIGGQGMIPQVVPHGGTWIEIVPTAAAYHPPGRRTSRRYVD